MYALFALFGGGIGLVVFAAALGGWEFLILGRSDGFWDGPIAMFLLTGLGLGWGLVSYRYQHQELDADTSGLIGALISRPGRTVIIGIVALYFLYDLARGL